MCDVRRIKAADMFPFVQEIMAKGGIARITVTGMSMYPFLRENIDSVELSHAVFDNIKRGDIVLAHRNNGQYFLHRIWRKEKNFFFMVGDAQMWIDGPYRPDQLIAVVHRYWRKEKLIDCSSLCLRLLVSLWLRLRPFRENIFRSFRFIRRYIKGKKRNHEN